MSDNEKNADLCIIGAGVAGITIAKELIGSGVRVLLVESGSSEPNRFSKAMSFGETSGMPYWSLDTTRSRQVGGTAGLWFLDLLDGRPGLRLRPLDKIDLQAREEIPHSGWPISYDTLSAYNDKTEELFQIAGAEQWDPPNGDGHLCAQSDVIRSVNFRLSPSELFTDVYPQLLREASNIEILSNTTVKYLRVDDSGKTVTSAVAVTDGGVTTLVKAKRYVIACGGIETPRLLLLSQLQNSSQIGCGMKNVGRYFMEHPHFLSGRVVPSDSSLLTEDTRYQKHASNGVTNLSKIALSEEILQREQLPNFYIHLSRSSNPDHELEQSYVYDAIRISRSYLRRGRIPPQSRRLLKEIVTGLPLLLQKITKRAGHHLAAEATVPTHFDLYHMSEQVPNPDSRVTLGRTRDLHGQPCARLDWQLTEGDFAGILKGQQIIDRELRKYGVGCLIRDEYSRLPPPGVRGGYHHMGTTRMSDRPDRGVVDSNCKVHGTANLFIAGSSVFTTGGVSNPTFTIAALALRLADHLKSEL